VQLPLPAPVSVFRLVAVSFIDPPFSRMRYKSSYSMDRYEKEPLSVQERILFPTSAAEKKAREDSLRKLVLESGATPGETFKISRGNDGLMKRLERLAAGKT
jgi:hypothetical protein